MNDEDVLLALKALADADRDREAPPQVEERLRFAFRSRKKKQIWPWMLAVAAAVAMMFGVVYLRSGPAPRMEAIAEPPRAIQPAPVAVEPVPAPAVVKAAARPPRRPAATREMVTDFFPLVEIAPSLDRAALVRVNLPATAMRTVGLPVREDRLFDRVNADVLVSEEGVATAIRFVKYQ